MKNLWTKIADFVASLIYYGVISLSAGMVTYVFVSAAWTTLKNIINGASNVALMDIANVAITIILFAVMCFIWCWAAQRVEEKRRVRKFGPDVQ